MIEQVQTSGIAMQGLYLVDVEEARIILYLRFFFAAVEGSRCVLLAGVRADRPAWASRKPWVVRLGNRGDPSKKHGSN